MQTCDCPTEVIHVNAGEQKAKSESSSRLAVTSRKLTGKTGIEDDELVLNKPPFLWSSVDFIIWASLGQSARAFWLLFGVKQEHQVWVISLVSAFKADCWGVIPDGKKNNNKNYASCSFSGWNNATKPVCNHMHFVSVIKITFLNWFLIYYSPSLCADVHCKHINIEAVSKHPFIRSVCWSQWKLRTADAAAGK